MRLRAEVLATIRGFFAERGVTEVATPVLAPATVTDPHIASIEVPGYGYLQTSPEYQMKRLLAAGAGGIHRLPRHIPFKQAVGMILTGRRVGAAEGKELGFVNEVTPAGGALEGAKRWAARIMECSPMSLRATKQASMRGLNPDTSGGGRSRQKSISNLAWGSSGNSPPGARACRARSSPA